jgi:two-component system response regulator HydG
LSVLYVPAGARDRGTVRDRLVRAGAEVTIAGDLAEALQLVNGKRYRAVVVDLAGETQAVATIRVLRVQCPAVPVIAVMDPADPASCAEALSAGVADLLPWPFEDRDVQAALAAARDRAASEAADSWPGSDEKLLVHSPAMREAVDQMRQASSRKTSLLLTGEPGTGRTLLARARHALDHEFVTSPFVVVDCGATGGSDLERRLFGCGGSADAEVPRAEDVCRGGAVVMAQGGALLLVNLTEAPARVQSRLAGLLRDREAFSLDANEIISLDIRFMASVPPDIESAVADGRVHRDLVQRIGQLRIEVPPLRRRREDLPALIGLFLRRVCLEERSSPKRFSRAAVSLMAALPWSGNAIELSATVRTIVRATRQPLIQLEDVLGHVSLDGVGKPTVEDLSLREARARFEREYISQALLRHHGRAGDAARSLGIQRTNLYRKVRQLKVSKALLSAQR